MNKYKHENVYFPDSIERVLRVLEKRETSTTKRKPARERHAPIERLGPKRNQYGDGLSIEHVCSKLDRK